MLESFWQVINRLKEMPRKRICAAAADESVLECVRDFLEEDFAGAVLVGNKEHIWRMACRVSLNLDLVEILHQPEPEAALYTAYKTVSDGDADVLMKGSEKSAEFLQVVSSGAGRGSNAFLSSLTACEVPGYDRLIYVTDAGVNISPDFNEKVLILKNAVSFLHALNIDTPRVAVLSANEKVTPKMPVTVEAQRLADLFHSGAMTGALVEGPVALDVAVNKKAARQKGIKDPVASNADLLLVPGVEVGSLLVRGIVNFARGRTASVVLGADIPAVSVDKNQTPQERVHSLALACYALCRKPGR